MTTIIIKTQAEIDALPSSFDQRTVIEIRSTERIYVSVARENSRVEAWGNSRVVARENSIVEARGNSRVEAWGNSRVVARENSRVEAWGNSRVVARENSRVVARENSIVEARGNSRVDGFLCSTIFVYSVCAVIKSIRDNARLVYRKENCQRPVIVDHTAIITEYTELVTPTFDQWLERGYVVADGITKTLVSHKTVSGVTIFEVTDSFGKEKSFVARIGDKFAHGKTIEEAKNDLRYKLSDRDTSKYKSWKLEDVVPVDEMIESYMAITGACSFGTKHFCESIKLKDSYSPKEIIEVTTGRYGNDKFKEFFGVNS